MTPRTPTRSATRLLLLLALALFAPGCGQILCAFFPGACGSPPELAGIGEFSITAVVTRLDTRTAPLALEDDGDNKDVKAKDRVTFKPSKGSEDGLDKRYRMASKQDDGEACLAVQLELLSATSSWVRVAIDDSDGLVDGQSLAFLERRNDAPGEGEPMRVRAEAVWNAAAQGFTLRARVDGALVGTPDVFAETSELFLFLGPTNVLAMQVAGPGHADFGPSSVLVEGLLAPAGPYHVAVGAEDLGKKAAFWFDELAFTMSTSVLGVAEQEVAYPLGQAFANLQQAELLAGFPTGDPGQIASLLANASLQVMLAGYAAQSALDGGQFAEGLDGGLVYKAVQKVQVKVGKAQKKALKLSAQEQPNGKGLVKPVEAATQALSVAMATLHGFSSLSSKRLAESIEIY